MATREERLAQFEINGAPEPDLAVELLCEDHNGTYVLPFPCRFVAGSWVNIETAELVEAEVVGWRVNSVG